MNNKPKRPQHYSKLTKEERYRHVMQLSTHDIWTHMMSRLATVPTYKYIEDLSLGQRDVLEDILAVEEEWTVDEEERARKSIINWDNTQD